MGPFTLDNNDKLQCDNIVMNWVLYPFHDDVVMTLLSSSPSANEPLFVILFKLAQLVNFDLALI